MNQTQRLGNNHRLKNNNAVFGILTLVFQIVAGLLYGFFVRPNFVSNGVNDKQFGNTIIPWFLTFCYAMLVIPGFGLLLSYLKKIVWSGLGFTFFITAFTLQLYFLVNALWSWTSIEQGNTQADKPSFLNRKYYFALSYNSGGTFGNTFTYAFKAALANVVGFSAIIGRAGLLQAWILTFFGTIGFQLQRVILTNYSYDGPSTFIIFIYGGFLGLTSSVLLRFKQNKQSQSNKSLTTAKHKLYTSNTFATSMALLGTAITWVFFPVLALDPTLLKGASFTSYTAPLSIVFALCSSTLMSFVTSSFINHKIIIRDIIYGSIAGGVSSATASTFITNPAYAILIGAVSGTIQVLGHNYIEKVWVKQKSIIHSTSFILFGVQGLIGAAFAAGWNAIIWTQSNGFVYNTSPLSTESIPLKKSYWEILMGLFSGGFGISVGLLVGIIIMFFASHKRVDHFYDYAYWIDDDGISKQIIYQNDRQLIPPSSPHPSSDLPQIEVIEGNHCIKDQHAYL